jgi:hypothetical protein
VTGHDIAHDGVYTKEGFAAFVDGSTRHPRPEPKTVAELKGMAPDERTAYDDSRHDWHANLGPYGTSAATEIVDEIWEVCDSNRQSAEKVKPSVAVDGLPGTGKSTLLLQFAKRYHLAKTARHGSIAPGGGQRLPVCVTTLDGNVSRLGFNKAILAFYGWPHPKKGSADELKPYVRAAMTACGTEVVLVDDVHFLNPTTKDGRDVSNHLKHLSSVLNVTFVFGGVGIDLAGLLTEGQGKANPQRQSTGRRWSMIPIEPMPRGPEWISLLKATEQDLVLAKARPRMLSKHCEDILWRRTAGNLQSLHNILKTACHRAISRGIETLDADLIERIRTDNTAQRLFTDNGGAEPARGIWTPGQADVA